MRHSCAVSFIVFSMALTPALFLRLENDIYRRSDDVETLLSKLIGQEGNKRTHEEQDNNRRYEIIENIIDVLLEIKRQQLMKQLGVSRNSQGRSSTTGSRKTSRLDGTEYNSKRQVAASDMLAKRGWVMTSAKAQSRSKQMTAKRADHAVQDIDGLINRLYKKDN